MSRISDRLAELRGRGEKALIPYIMAGDPDMSATHKLILKMVQSGADIIELGVPFSDPPADGPTIQLAAIRSLKHKTNLKDVFKLVKELRKESQVPIILMLYYNLIFVYGEERFARDAVKCGVDGVIIPDLPPEEAAGMLEHARKTGLDTIFLVAPTSSGDRIDKVAGCSTGFIYYVSLTGVTGTRDSLGEGIESSIHEIRNHTGMPICCGFGISRPEQAALVAGWADGVIVGSAIVKIIGETGGNTEKMLNEVGGFIRSLKDGVLSGS